jgi:hypothetical protein
MHHVQHSPLIGSQSPAADLSPIPPAHLQPALPDRSHVCRCMFCGGKCQKSVETRIHHADVKSEFLEIQQIREFVGKGLMHIS